MFKKREGEKSNWINAIKKKKKKKIDAFERRKALSRQIIK